MPGTAIQGKFLKPLEPAQGRRAGAAHSVRRLPAHVLNLEDPGAALPTPILTRLEAYFGESLASVRIHEGRQAELLGAVAFAMGEHVFLAKGRYKPFTVRGLRLLGHEIAHVLQQRHGAVQNPLGEGVVAVADAALEALADHHGRALAAGITRTQGTAPGEVPAPRSAGGGTVLQAKYRSDKEVLDAGGKLEAARFSSFFGGEIRVLGPDTLRHQLIEEVATGKHYIYDRHADKYHSVMAERADERDPVEFLEDVVPAWASMHRAMALEAEQFEELAAGQLDEQVTRCVIYGERARRDQDVIIDLACRKTKESKGAVLHLGQFRGEMIAGAIYFRVYLTIMEHHPLRTNQKNHRYTAYKEVKQLETGALLITGTGEGGSPDADTGSNPKIYFNVGRPMRAYAWAAKYAEQDPGSTPTVRSFLVPMEPMLDLIFEATREDEQSPNGARIQNSDYDRTGGQFGIGGAALTMLRKLAVPRSLITYSDHISTLDPYSGVLRSLADLGALVGIPETEVAKSGFTSDGEVGFRPTRINPDILKIPKQDVRERAMKGAIAKRPSAIVATELQVVVAHWFGNALLLPDGVAMGNRRAVVGQFLEDHGFSPTAIEDALATMS